MKQILKNELLRSFKGFGFKISILIGCIISIVHILFKVIPISLNLDKALSYNFPMVYPGWLYSSWMGGNGVNFEGFLFFLIAPILASLPFAETYYTDLKGGIIKNICIRTKKRYYYASKYIAVVLSGGAAVTIPLVLNFLLSCLLLPSMKPEVCSSYTGITETSMFGILYYSHPMAYLLIFLIIDFIFFGFISTLSLFVSRFVENRFIVLLAPFLTYLFIFSLFNLLDLTPWEPLNFLQPHFAYSRFSIVFLETLVLGLVTFTSFVIKGAKDDIY